MNEFENNNYGYRFSKKELERMERDAEEENSFLNLCDNDIYSYYFYHKSISEIILVENGQFYIFNNTHNLDFIVFDITGNFDILCDTRTNELNKDYFINNPFYTTKEKAILLIKYIDTNNNFTYNSTIIIFQNTIKDNLAKYTLKYNLHDSEIIEEFISTDSMNTRIQLLKSKSIKKIFTELIVGNQIEDPNCYEFEKYLNDYVYTSFPMKIKFVTSYIWRKSIEINECKNTNNKHNFWLLFNCIDTLNFILKYESNKIDSKILTFLNTLDRYVNDDVCTYLEAEENGFGYQDNCYD